VDLGEIIRRTNEAAHSMMPYVEGYYQELERGRRRQRVS
jgi:hypothetical protein